jgi:hypothetical protein
MMAGGLSRPPEWSILRTWRVNGILVGAPHLTSAAVAAMDDSVRYPLVWWSPEQSRDVPEFAAGTLVIRDVDRLEQSQQEQLSHWIDRRCPRVQVLALARAPLFPHVLDGRFSAALYYCMNTVVVEVRAAADLP